MSYTVCSYVRIGPQEVAIADIEAFRIIHRVGSDYSKGPWYQGQAPSQTTDETSGVFNIASNKKAAHRRRLFQSAGTRKIVAEWEPQIVELANTAVEKIKRDLEKYGSSDIMKWWTFMASDVTGMLAFGESFNNTRNEERNQLIRDIETAMPFIGMRIELPWTKPIMDAIPSWFPSSISPIFDRFNEYGQIAVRATRMAAQNNNKTLFSKMVLEEESKQVIPDSLIEKEAQNIIIAGTDNTAMTLTYLIYAVLKDENTEGKLVEELKSCTARPSWEELEDMPYLNNIIQETLRLYPAIPGSLPRIVPLGGEHCGKYIIPAKGQVSTQAWTFQRDPTVFKDALRFDPDRWQNASPKMKEHMMAFGGPARVCLGQNIARLEILHAVSKLFRECPDITLAPSTTEESMEMVDYFAIKPKAAREYDVDSEN
ncbi:Nn.00g072440.m01.CDS01 [Neocucurbitaria sp. VM-36]